MLHFQVLLESSKERDHYHYEDLLKKEIAVVKERPQSDTLSKKVAKNSNSV